MMKQLERMPPHYPTNVTLELTLRCNLHCAMCMFRHSDGENPKLSAGELTAAQWEDMARGDRAAGSSGYGK